MHSQSQQQTTQQQPPQQPLQQQQAAAAQQYREAQVPRPSQQPSTPEKPGWGYGLDIIGSQASAFWQNYQGQSLDGTLPFRPFARTPASRVRRCGDSHAVFSRAGERRAGKTHGTILKPVIVGVKIARTAIVRGPSPPFSPLSPSIFLLPDCFLASLVCLALMFSAIRVPIYTYVGLRSQNAFAHDLRKREDHLTGERGRGDEIIRGRMRSRLRSVVVSAAIRESKRVRNGETRAKRRGGKAMLLRSSGRCTGGLTRPPLIRIIAFPY